MKPRPVYEINSGERFPQVDNTMLTTGGQLGDVIERIKLNPVKEMNHEQKGTMIYTNFNTQPNTTTSQSKHGVKAGNLRQAREKSRTQFTVGFGFAPDWLNMFLLIG